MSNSNEVLNMIASGKISAAEGLQLLEAMRSPRDVTTTNNNRWLHVRVSDLGSNRQRVNINLPTSWLEAGLRIGRNFAPELKDVDWQQISEVVKSGNAGRLLEVEDLDDNQRVEIFLD
jgi:SHOCT-like protein